MNICLVLGYLLCVRLSNGSIHYDVLTFDSSSPVAGSRLAMHLQECIYRSDYLHFQ